MFKSLRIKNLILIEQAELLFGPGLNILTGETGSGKSAILTAIQLISGERAETQGIRKGAEFASVEAELERFDPTLLKEEGIAPPAPGAPLLVRREIHRSGKNRCFIEEQQVNLSFLRKLLSTSIERIDQSSSLSLSLYDEQRLLLDEYGDLAGSTHQLSLSYAEASEMETSLQLLLTSQKEKERLLKWAEEDLALIEETNWIEGEEEKLTEEHNFFSHAQELFEKVGGAAVELVDGPALSTMRRCHAQLEACLRLDPGLKEITETLFSASLELEEVGRCLESYMSRLEADPARLEIIEQRIKEIESLKRKFGATFAEVEKKKRAALAQIDSLASLDEKIGNLEKTLKMLQEKNQILANAITAKRKTAAPQFSTAVEEELKSLNLPHARFSVSIQPKPLSSHGADEIQFLFSANPGLPAIPLEQCASGGERQRLLLAVKTILSEKLKATCLVFDEIDSNVGGQTASIIGEKLKKLAAMRQVICVTHFVKVAQCALDHFLVSKTEENGSAYTHVCPLSSAEREREYNRMLGKR